MTEVFVLEPDGSELAEQIKAAVNEYPESRDNIRVRTIRSVQEIGGEEKLDLLVLSNDAPKTDTVARRPISCAILLLPGDAGADRFDAVCLVTYGMSPKDTITLSAISEETCVLAIQREFVTTQNEILDRQELKIRGGLRPESLLAVAGVLLILGLGVPEENG